MTAPTRPAWLPENVTTEPTCVMHPDTCPTTDGHRENTKAGLAAIGIELVISEKAEPGTVHLWDPLGHVKT